jgi:HSP20 family protein
MDELRQAMEQVAAQAAASDAVPETRSFAPDVDLHDAGVVLVARVDVPGMKPADLTVSIEDGVLKIEGHREAQGSGGEAYLCCERPTGRFVRTLRLPPSVDVGSARATLGDGVLEIILPKGEEHSLARVVVQIEVVSGAEQPADAVAHG